MTGRQEGSQFVSDMKLWNILEYNYSWEMESSETASIIYVSVLVILVKDVPEYKIII